MNDHDPPDHGPRHLPVVSALLSMSALAVVAAGIFAPGFTPYAAAICLYAPYAMMIVYGLFYFLPGPNRPEFEAGFTGSLEPLAIKPFTRKAPPMPWDDDLG